SRSLLAGQPPAGLPRARVLPPLEGLGPRVGRGLFHRRELGQAFPRGVLAHALPVQLPPEAGQPFPLLHEELPGPPFIDGRPPLHRSPSSTGGLTGPPAVPAPRSAQCRR